ncbi:hypothetical protein DM02DRAFT_638647 [Periconia macrospinosa]|uniref:Uncharacterized protein n=1 Tax=Periconia macrospinosa TaxID=97972 RepID=A0A2V1E950_9PLEO|nr:hypothetical protein DM02DRAFT_638647 [Periconia macrospinosa]
MNSSPTCYFSLPVINTTAHFSLETPNTSPLSAYSPDILPDPRNPLLAFRETASDCCMSSHADSSKLLQLQTKAANRPAAQPLQQSSTTPSSDSDSSSSSRSSNMGSRAFSPVLCCSRCRRESGTGMIQFGTNIYYCTHCARMTGYCAG